MTLIALPAYSDNDSWMRAAGLLASPADPRDTAPVHIRSGNAIDANGLALAAILGSVDRKNLIR